MSRRFSTPNVPPKTKIKMAQSHFSPGLSPGPLPGGLYGKNKFVTPDLSSRAQITLSHPLDNSITISKVKRIRVTFDLNFCGTSRPSVLLWKLIKQAVDDKTFYKLVGDWLIEKSTGKSTFKHLVRYFVDYFSQHDDFFNDCEIKKRKSDQFDSTITTLQTLWSNEFISELGYEIKETKLANENLEPLYRILFVLKEELLLSQHFSLEAKFLIDILPKIYRVSPITQLIEKILSKQSVTSQLMSIPLSYNATPTSCFIVNLYMIIFYGLNPVQTRQLVSTDLIDFMKNGTQSQYELPPNQTTNHTLLFQLLEHIPFKLWLDLPISYGSHIRRYLIKLSSENLSKSECLCLRRILSDNNDQSFVSFDHSQLKIEDGLECLDGHGFTKFIFPEDLRTVSARELLSTYQPVTSAQIGISRHQQHTQIKIEQTFVEMSQRTVAKMFGRGLATFAQSTINPVVDRFKEPKADFSLKLEQALIQAGLFSPDLASAGTLSRQELAEPWIEWPFYHNSVAWGLSLSDGLSLSSSWLIWNKPEKLSTLSNATIARVAGGLLGICLRGYLELSPLQTILKFTQDRKPLILVSLFLGLCASKKYAGSRNDSLLRLLTIHLPAKFLVNKTEDLLQMTLGIQTAAILALGFLFRNEKQEIRHVSNISRYVDLMLDEINKRPDPERDMPNGRESYSTAAGYSVGLLLLGAGNDSSLKSLNIVNRLNTLITGGENKTDDVSWIMENDQINPWIVRTGAMAATALIFLGTSDMVIASWFNIPKSAKLLEGLV